MGFEPEVPQQILLVEDWVDLPYASPKQPLMCPTCAVAQEKGVAPAHSAGRVDHHRHLADERVV